MPVDNVTACQSWSFSTFSNGQHFCFWPKKISRDIHVHMYLGPLRYIKFWFWLVVQIEDPWFSIVTGIIVKELFYNTRVWVPVHTFISLLIFINLHDYILHVKLHACNFYLCLLCAIVFWFFLTPVRVSLFKSLFGAMGLIQKAMFVVRGCPSDPPSKPMVLSTKFLRLLVYCNIFCRHPLHTGYQRESSNHKDWNNSCQYQQ